MKLGLKQGLYEYECSEGIKFSSGYWFKKFSKDMFANKSKASKHGQKAKALAYKIIANSGYGFWGLRTKDRDAKLYDFAKLACALQPQYKEYCKLL